MDEGLFYVLINFAFCNSPVYFTNLNVKSFIYSKNNNNFVWLIIYKAYLANKNIY